MLQHAGNLAKKSYFIVVCLAHGDVYHVSQGTIVSIWSKNFNEVSKSQDRSNFNFEILGNV